MPQWIASAYTQHIDPVLSMIRLLHHTTLNRIGKQYFNTSPLMGTYNFKPRWAISGTEGITYTMRQIKPSKNRIFFRYSDILTMC